MNESMISQNVRMWDLLPELSLFSFLSDCLSIFSLKKMAEDPSRFSRDLVILGSSDTYLPSYVSFLEVSI